MQKSAALLTVCWNEKATLLTSADRESACASGSLQALAACSHSVTGLQVVIPAKLEEQLKAGMQEAGIPVPDTPERWGQAMTALKVFLIMFQLVETPCAS